MDGPLDSTQSTATIMIDEATEREMMHFSALKLYAVVLGNVVWSLCAAVGIPANLLVIACLLRSNRDVRSISSIFILNIAVADLLFLLGTPFVIVQSIEEDWVFGHALCKLYISATATSQFGSATFIAVLSLDRWLAVCQPLKAATLRTRKVAVVTCCIAWTLVIIEMLPLFTFAKLIRKRIDPADPGHASCMLFWGAEQNIEINLTMPTGGNLSEYEQYIDEHVRAFQQTAVFSRRFFTSYVFALSYLIPLIAVWYFYGNIIRIMWKRRTLFFQKSGNRRRRTTKVTTMGLAVVVFYTACWAPFWCLQWSIETELSWIEDPSALIVVSYAAYALQWVNSAVNPFLYVLLSDHSTINICRLFDKNRYSPARHRANGDLMAVGGGGSLGGGGESQRMLSQLQPPQPRDGGSG